MHPILGSLNEHFNPGGHLKDDVAAFLRLHGYPKTAVHCLRVGAQAAKIAERFGVEVEPAQQAGWLHDVSAVFPPAERAVVARELGLDVLPEEERFPLIVHQKLSVVLAREIFNVTNQAILSAVGCHTTLKVGASALDKTLFVADKIAWDQPGEPPYQTAINRALDESLDAAVKVYLQHMWEIRESLAVLHPWMLEACGEYGVGL